MLRKSVLALSLPVVALAMSACSLDTSGASAEIGCEELVQEQVGDAEFEHRTVKDNGDGTWMVRGFADAGGVRHVYGCTVTVEDGSAVRGTLDELEQS